MVRAQRFVALAAWAAGVVPRICAGPAEAAEAGGLTGDAGTTDGREAVSAAGAGDATGAGDAVVATRGSASTGTGAGAAGVPTVGMGAPSKDPSAGAP